MVVRQRFGGIKGSRYAGPMRERIQHGGAKRTRVRDSIGRTHRQRDTWQKGKGVPNLQQRLRGAEANQRLSHGRGRVHDDLGVPVAVLSTA